MLSNAETTEASAGTQRETAVPNGTEPESPLPYHEDPSHTNAHQHLFPVATQHLDSWLNMYPTHHTILSYDDPPAYPTELDVLQAASVNFGSPPAYSTNFNMLQTPSLNFVSKPSPATSLENATKQGQTPGTVGTPTSDSSSPTHWRLRCDKCNITITSTNSKFEASRNLRKHRMFDCKKASTAKIPCGHPGCKATFKRPDNRIQHRRRVHGQRRSTTVDFNIDLVLSSCTT
jgi:hypothetical protein